MLDTTALTVRPTREQLTDLRRRRDRGEFGRANNPLWGVIIGSVIFLVAGSIITAAWRMVLANGDGFGRIGVFPLITAAIAGIGIVATVTTAIWRFVKFGPTWARLALFADANQRQLRLADAAPRYPGRLFALGHDRSVPVHLVAEPPLVDVGTFAWRTGSGDDEKSHHADFAAYWLPSPLPQLVLDSSHFSGRIGTGLAGAQRVSLGAPFDQHFTTYAPDGYQVDAFHLLPPSLMEALLPLAPDFDVEMVDRWLFLYPRSAEALTTPAFWQVLESTGQQVATRVGAGTYVDRRPDAVPGQVRLRNAVQWWWLLLIPTLAVLGLIVVNLVLFR